MTRFLRRWGPALLWTALLFGASSRSSLPVEFQAGSDKLAHLAAYTVLGLLLARGQWLQRIHLAWPIAIGIAIGGLDELYQSTVPNRHAELADWVADSVGVVLGVFLFHGWRRRADRGRRAPARSRPVPDV